MSDDDGAVRRVPVKVEGRVDVKVKVRRESEDDGMVEREGGVGGKRRKVEGGEDPVVKVEGGGRR